MVHRALVAGCLLAAATVALVASPSKNKVRVEVGVEGTEAEAEAYVAANRAIVQRNVPEAVKTCARDAAEDTIVRFDLAVPVGKGGKPGKPVATPANAFTQCVGKAVSELTFTEPPHDPTGVHFEVSFPE